MRVLVAGASGFIGAELVDRLTAGGHEVVRLVRRRAQAPDEVSWSPAAGIIDFTVMDRVDAVVNLAGASLARIPWTKAYRREILDSRVTRRARSPTRCATRRRRHLRQRVGGRLLRRPSGRTAHRVLERRTGSSRKSSRVGGGSDGSRRGDARRHPAHRNRGRPARAHGHGGGLKRVGTLTKLGVSGRLGSGGQHWPWIALADEAGRSSTCSTPTSAVRSTSPDPRRRPPTGS